MTFPLVLETAFGQEKDILDRSPDGDRLTDLEHPGHGKVPSDALVRVLRHRRYIVSEKNAALVGGPFEHVLIVSSGQAGLLDRDDINFRVTPNYAAYDSVVEILVRGEAKQVARSLSLAEPSGGRVCLLDQTWSRYLRGYTQLVLAESRDTVLLLLGD